MGKRARRDESPKPAGTSRGRLAATVLSLLAVVGLAGAWALAPRGRVRRDPGLSVLLITVDTLRADALGAYGNAAASTPWIDRLAAGGARFDDAHAQNVLTLPSHANILSGRYPFDHGVRDNAGFRFPADRDSLATLLKARGYRTGAFVSAFPLDSRFGLARGFDVYDDRFGATGSHVAFHMEERRGGETVAAARRWLDAQAGAPTFCWVHVYEPHAPYAPPEPFASRYRGDPYHGEVAAADDALRPLLEPLVGADRRGRTLVVLTADHGESLGEHGEMTHGIFAYEATLHVPLVMYQPGILPPAVVRAPVRHVDVLPTILDALGLPAPDGLPGRSLLPLAASQALPDAPSYFESLAPALNRGWAPLTGVLRGDVKYVDLPLPELYDLAADPGEGRNLVASQPEMLERGRGLLGSFRSADRGVGRSQETAETRERLRSLGYVTASATGLKQRYTDADDPKRLIALDATLEEVIGRYTAGDVEGALSLCEGLVGRKPDMALSLVHLAFLRHETGDLHGALEAGRRALALNPDQADVAALLGAYLNDAGKVAEALALLEPFAKRKEPDLDILIAYGVNLAAAGRRAEALTALERVRASDPSNAMALVNIGTVHLMAQDDARAREAFEAALALDPRVARADNSLGVIAARGRRYDEALARWKQAAALDPRDHEVLYNIGTLLIQLGRAAEARPYLERYVREAPRATDARDIARVRQWLAQAPSS